MNFRRGCRNSCRTLPAPGRRPKSSCSCSYGAAYMDEATKVSIEALKRIREEGAEKNTRHRKLKCEKVERGEGAALLEDVLEFLSRFIAYPSDHALIAHVLWIAHTHLTDQAKNAEPSLSPNRHLVEVPDTFAIARWRRDADVANNARCIIGTQKDAHHTAAIP